MTDPVTDTAELKLMAEQALKNAVGKWTDKKVKKNDLKVGMILFRRIIDKKTGKLRKMKVRIVLETWNGAHVKTELARWHIYLGGWGATQDWDRARFYEVASGKTLSKEGRCTQVGLARWADGVVEP